jgi:hypothetical protein
VAPAYALLSLAVAVVIGISPIRIDEGAIRASFVGAFLWPFLIAGAAGFAGGVMSAGDETTAESDLWRRTVAAVVGGWRMLIGGVVFAFVGLVILAAVKPDDGRVVFPGISEFGSDGGLALLTHNLLVLPNEAVWTLSPSMGACNSLDAGIISFDFLCYQHFPGQEGEEAPVPGGLFGGEGGGLPSFGSAPPVYLMFLLVPLLATILGGRWAGARGRTRGEGVALGAASGVVFGIFAGAAALLAGISISASGQVGFGAGGTFSIGPQIVNTGMFGILWGVGGGVVGALTAARASGGAESAPPGTSGPAAAPPGRELPAPPAP